MKRCLILLGLLVCAGPMRAEDPGTIRADEDLLRSAEIQIDGPGLLRYLRLQTLRENDRARIEVLIKQLGADDYEKREQATADLIQKGSLASQPLQQATGHPDLEVARRAERCLEAIAQRSNPTCLAAAIRLLGVRQPEGAVEVLLAFLPSSSDPNEIDEASRVLGRLGMREGVVDPLLVGSLGAREGIKRAVAGEVLARAGLAGRVADVRKLLADREPMVRCRVGLALLESRDRDAVPVLIDLLREVEPEQSAGIEETLLYLAGDRAPADVSGYCEADRQRRVKGWLTWWKERGQEVDLARLDLHNRQLGYTLLVLYGINNGSVREIDRAGKVRWQINNLNYPIDAQALPGDRVLICEYRGRTVTERDLQGRVVWQYNPPTYPISARRLPGGITLVVTRMGLVEVDRQGKEVWRSNHTSVAAGARMRDGSSIVVLCTGQIIRIDRQGKVLKSFQAGGAVTPLGAGVDVAPDGRILFPLYSQNKVVELDAEGKRIWEAEVRTPGSVCRLPGGKVLVASRLNPLVQELDRSGKPVWTHQVEGRLMRASRR